MKYSYDENGVRYCLAKTNHSQEINWVFLPGGPGADSRYLLTLIGILNIPGNTWLVDLPGNGDNVVLPDDYDYKNWISLLPTIASRFSNCIFVGHSIGGMLPLLSPLLEKRLSGLILINSAPSLWMLKSAQAFQERGIPTPPEKDSFLQHPTQENLKRVLLAYSPYYFNKDSLDKGRNFFESLLFSIPTMEAVYKLFQDINYTAKWIPQKVKTLLIGGDQDVINPFCLFQKDERFNKPNITRVLLEGCGHWCWIEQPKAVKHLFETFL